MYKLLVQLVTRKDHTILTKEKITIYIKAMLTTLKHSDQQNIFESLQNQSMDFLFLETSSSFKFDHTNSIIRLQAFGRLRQISSLLGLISQPQPEKACGLIIELV